jgi:hypothetical protein
MTLTPQGFDVAFSCEAVQRGTLMPRTYPLLLCSRASTAKRACVCACNCSPLPTSPVERKAKTFDRGGAIHPLPCDVLFHHGGGLGWGFPLQLPRKRPTAGITPETPPPTAIDFAPADLAAPALQPPVPRNLLHAADVLSVLRLAPGWMAHPAAANYNSPLQAWCNTTLGRRDPQFGPLQDVPAPRWKPRSPAMTAGLTNHLTSTFYPVDLLFHKKRDGH